MHGQVKMWSNLKCKEMFFDACTRSNNVIGSDFRLHARSIHIIYMPSVFYCLPRSVDRNNFFSSFVLIVMKRKKLSVCGKTPYLVSVCVFVHGKVLCDFSRLPQLKEGAEKTM